jgi:hypothetical protein
MNANAVFEDGCRGDAIQCRNATTPNRATVPYGAEMRNFRELVREMREDAPRLRAGKF